MDNMKIGTELYIALNTSKEERVRSLDLNVGYDDKLDEWELIIKYIGDINTLEERYATNITELLGGYGILKIKSNQIDALSGDRDIIFIEKPKSFYEERTQINGFTASCMDIPFYINNLRGKGVMATVIDSGIDYSHPDFIGEAGTKIFELWDQTVMGNPPMGYDVGSVFTRDDINSAINSENKDSIVPSVDISGHGTGVAGVIAACTPEVDFLIIKLNTLGEGVDVNTISIMKGIDYAVRKSIELAVPMVINLSYGNNYGNHNGNTILEEYMDVVSRLSRLSIVVGSGNDGNSGRHTELTMGNLAWYRRDFIVSEGEGGINLQIWRSYQDVVDVFLITPSGNELGPFNLNQEIMRYNVGNMRIVVLNAYPTPINLNQETYISIIPDDTYIEAGVWSIRFNPKSITDGKINVWLPVEGSTSARVEFLVPSEYTTLTIPSTAKNIITVGAYDSQRLIYADFSGRGFTVNQAVKPDLVAPGVNIDVPRAGGGYRIVSGTSFATPFVSSGAIMLMEYGIVRENDMFLYGDKLKAYLINGTGRLPGIDEIPSPLVGWGYLCVRDSLPE